MWGLAASAFIALANPALPGSVLLAVLVGIGAVGTAAVVRQWIGAWTPLARSPVNGGALTIIIPAWNEAANIQSVIAGIPRHALGAAGWQPSVVVVDDGSADDTAAVARDAGAEHVLSHSRNLGLGAALRTGLAAARELGARAAVYIDADGEYDPAIMLRLLTPIASGEADYVLASRFRGKRVGMRLLQAVGNRGFTFLTSLLCGRWLTDAQTGYRAFSGQALERAEIIHDYNYAQVLTLNLLRKRMRLREVPGDYRVRQNGKSFIRRFEYCRRVLPAIARELLSD